MVFVRISVQISRNPIKRTRFNMRSCNIIAIGDTYIYRKIALLKRVKIDKEIFCSEQGKYYIKAIRRKELYNLIGEQNASIFLSRNGNRKSS